MTTEKKILTRDEILTASDYETKVVEIPEWGGSVRLRTMTGKARDEFEAEVSSKTIGGNVDVRGIKAYLLSRVIVDEKDELMFTPEDVEALNSKAAGPLNSLFEIASRMNGIGEEAAQSAEKN